MAVSFGMLGILLMLDICFILNYFIVRTLRYWTDKTQQDKEEKVKPASEGDAIGDVAFAWLVGSVRLEAMSVRKFPGYRKIPYGLGLLSTSFFVILSSILLAPDLVSEHLGIPGITLDADFCVNERFDAGLEELKAEIYTQTHYLEAHKQYHAITYLQDLLLNDTALYGVPPFQCPPHPGQRATGNKLDWNLEHDFGVPFFPNYCQNALESAVEAARERECFTEVCKCPTLPDNPVFQMAGLANRELCAAEVCIPVPTACPPHEMESLVNTALLEDYRYQQLLTAEQRRNNMTLQDGHRVKAAALKASDAVPEDLKSGAAHTAEKILFQVDVASYIYIAYSCMAMFFPSPLILFRIPYLHGLKRFLFGVQKPYFISMVVALWWGIEYFQAVWYSPDLWLFVHNVRVGDPCFVDPSYLTERQSLLAEVCEAMMPMEQAFLSAAWTVVDVWREVRFFQESCDCPFPNQYTPQFDVGNLDWLGFNNTFEVCNGQDCTTLYNMPSENIEYVGNASICHNGTAARRMVWESHADDETTQQNPDMWSEVWIASGFLATVFIKVAVANFGISLMELADPFVVCAGEFLWMPTTFGRKRASRNSRQSRSSLESFDEEGRALPNEMVQAWFNTKQRSLIHISISKSIFWGLLVHLCIINLFMSVYQEVYSDGDFTREDVPAMYKMLEQNDRTVLQGCLGVAAAMIVLGVYIICKLYASAAEDRDQLPDTDESSDDEDPMDERERGQASLVLPQPRPRPSTEPRSYLVYTAN